MENTSDQKIFGHIFMDKDKEMTYFSGREFSCSKL